MQKHTVHCDPRSTCSMKVTHALYEAGVEFELRLVDLQAQEQKSERYAELNPFGKVPALTTPDGRVLYESYAIIKYLARIGSAALVPSDPYLEGIMDQFMCVSAFYFKPEQTKIYFEKVLKARYRKGEPNQERVEEGLNGIRKSLDALESHLMRTQGPYLCGDQFTLADMSFMPEMFWLDASGCYDIIRDRPRVFEWMQRCRERSAWRSAVDLARTSKPMDTALTC